METARTKGLGKRFGTVFTTLCLAASLMPATALAEEGTVKPQGSDPSTFVAVVPNEEGKSTFGNLDGNSEQSGLSVIADGESQSVTANGNIDNAADNGVVDFTIGANSNVTITGDVSVSQKDGGLGGVSVSASNGEANLTAGNVNYTGSDGVGTGVTVNAGKGGTANVTTGKVTASDASAAVMNLAASGGKTNVTVAGIEAKNTYAGAITGTGGIDQYVAGSPSASNSSLTVNGNVSGGREAGIWVSAPEGQANAMALGNVTANGAGVFVDASEDGEADVLVNGTIQGKMAGIVLAGKTSNICVTTWKIASDGELVVSNGIRPNATTNEGANLSKSVNYIIKLEQPKEGGKLFATNAKGEKLNTSHGYEVANAGDKVLAKVDLQPGYKILAAYNGDGTKTALTMDSDGNYYVVVPEGGGVYLSVELGLIDCAVVFQNDDGTVLQKNTLKYGDTPSYDGATPTKAEDNNYVYTFAGWKPQISPVTGDVTYVATYKAAKKAGKKQQDKKQAQGKEQGQSAKVVLARTGGTAVAKTRKLAPTGDDSLALAVPTLALATIALSSGIFKRRNAR